MQPQRLSGLESQGKCRLRCKEAPRKTRNIGRVSNPLHWPATQCLPLRHGALALSPPLQGCDRRYREERGCIRYTWMAVAEDQKKTQPQRRKSELVPAVRQARPSAAISRWSVPRFRRFSWRRPLTWRVGAGLPQPCGGACVSACFSSAPYMALPMPSKSRRCASRGYTGTTKVAWKSPAPLIVLSKASPNARPRPAPPSRASAAFDSALPSMFVLATAKVSSSALDKV